MVKHSFFTMGRPWVSKYWFCKNPNCLTPLVWEEMYCGRLYRGGAYSGYCLFKSCKNMLPGEILVDGGWRGQQLRCIGCNTVLGGRFIQVPPDRAGHPSKVGLVFLKMAKVSFGDGSSTMDGEAGVPAEPVFKHPETMAAQPDVCVSVRDSGQWVWLNVGGKKFLTTIDTLTRQPGSMLERMFSGNYEVKRSNGYVLIDRDGTYFGYILRWLRDATVPILKERLYPELLLEAEYYQLVDLQAAIQEILLKCNAQLNRKEVIEMIRIASSNKRLSFRGLNLSGQDFSRLELRNADLTKACLHGTNFEGASLLHADLSGCDAPNALFDNVSMNWSTLCKGNFSGASFVAADLPHVSAEECIFDSANCAGCYFGRAKLSRGTFKEANLSSADFYKAKLLGCNLSHAKLANAKMEDADLSGADLGSADLSGCVLSNANLQNASLIGAKLANAALKGANLLNADLRNTELGRANYLVAKFAGAKVDL